MPCSSFSPSAQPAEPAQRRRSVPRRAVSGCSAGGGRSEEPDLHVPVGRDPLWVSAAVVQRLSTANGADTVDSGDGDDEIRGGNGADELDAGAGAGDAIDGGRGKDTCANAETATNCELIP